MRIEAIDALRGVAVLGILLMNIVSFGFPFVVYDNPTVADFWWWFWTDVLVDGRMRAIFCMLFGILAVGGRHTLRARALRPVAVSVSRAPSASAPPPEKLEQEAQPYRGNWFTVFRHRAGSVMRWQSVGFTRTRCGTPQG